MAAHKEDNAKLVVLGNGMAGVSCVERLLHYGKSFDVTVIGEETWVNYNRIGLSSMLAGEKTEDDLILNPVEWYRENGVRLRLGERAVKIRREDKCVETDSGEEFHYDKLLMAVGSVPFIPPIPGTSLSGVAVFRSMRDTKSLISAADAGGRAVVVGGGLLGLECARGLQTRGMQATVLHLADRLMEMQLDETGGKVLLQAMRRLGMEAYVNANAAAVEGNGRVQSVRLADGRSIPADLVVFACGIRPNVGLAKSAGIVVNRGIVTDEAMRTSDPDIYAIGECAECDGRVYGLVAPIYEQARAAAANLAGDEGVRYRGSMTSASLKVAGVNVFSAGAVQTDDDCEIVKFEDLGAGVYKRLTVKDDRLVGAMLVGDKTGSDRFLDLIREGKRLGESRASLLFGSGLEEERKEDAVLLAPADKIVCGCLGVAKGKILDAVETLGLSSLKAVKEATKAGTGCGGCAPSIIALLKSHAGARYEAPKQPTLCECYDLTLSQLRAIARSQNLRSVSELAAIYAKRPEGCATCKPAVAFMMEEVWCGDHEEDRSHRFINDRMHANIQRDGSFSVVPRMRGGVTTPDELMRIARTAKKYGAPMVKITGSQRIDLLGVKREDLPKIWEELGMPCGHAFAKAVRMVKTCVGSTFCRFGVQDSIEAGVELEKRLENLYTPAKVKLAAVGCPRNCAEATVKDIGLVGVEGGWQVVIGGAAGKRVRAADLLCQVETRDGAFDAALLFFQHYRENAEYLERTYDFVERVGLDAIKAAVLYADDEAKQGLRDRLARSKERARDPWEETRKNKTGGFREMRAQIVG